MQETDRVHSELSEVGALQRVLLKTPKAAFVDEAHIAAQWRKLRFSAPPVLDAAIAEYAAFVDLIAATGARLEFLPPDGRTTLDSVYVRDASAVCRDGVVLGRMGKRLRADEPPAQRLMFEQLGVPILGEIVAPGCLEGGDVVWLDARTVAVGRSYRTNDDGIRQLRALLGKTVDALIEVQLPHWRGSGDVLHLMSLLSPVDRTLVVVFSPLLPVAFLEQLRERGYDMVEVPDEEFDSMGTNVLALAPRQCIMLAGNPRTRQALEHLGVAVVEYQGTEISVKGAGGPTCLTRPLARAPVPPP